MANVNKYSPYCSSFTHDWFNRVFDPSISCVCVCILTALTLQLMVNNLCPGEIIKPSRFMAPAEGSILIVKLGFSESNGSFFETFVEAR